MDVITGPQSPESLWKLAALLGLRDCNLVIMMRIDITNQHILAIRLPTAAT